MDGAMAKGFRSIQMAAGAADAIKLMCTLAVSEGSSCAGFVMCASLVDWVMAHSAVAVNAFWLVLKSGVPVASADTVEGAGLAAVVPAVGAVMAVDGMPAGTAVMAAGVVFAVGAVMAADAVSNAEAVISLGRAMVVAVTAESAAWPDEGVNVKSGVGGATTTGGWVPISH